MCFINFLFYILTILGVKLEMTPVDVEPNLLSSPVTILRYYIYKGIEILNISELNELPPYPFFQRSYVKKDNEILVSKLFYNNEVVLKNVKLLKILEKIRIMTNGLDDDKEEISKLPRMDLIDVKSYEDRIIFLIYEFTTHFVFTGKTREEYFKHLKNAFLLYINFSMNFNSNLYSSPNEITLIEKEIKDGIKDINEDEILRMFDICDGKGIISSFPYPDELIIPYEKFKVLKLLIN